MSHLLHPELIRSMPDIGDSFAEDLESYAEVVSAGDLFTSQYYITVAVRVRNEAPALDRFFTDLNRQRGMWPIEKLVIDYGSDDPRVAEVAERHEARLVPVERPDGPFKHGPSLNKCLYAATYDQVYLASAHTLLATDLALRAGSHYLRQGVSAASSYPYLPGYDTPDDARQRMSTLNGRLRPPRIVKELERGALCGSGVMLDRRIWDDVGGFDVREDGIEDYMLARTLLSHGMVIVNEPLMAHHHDYSYTTAEMAERVLKHSIAMRAADIASLPVNDQVRYA